AARACVFSGSGLITVSTHSSNFAALHSRCPEAMVSDITDLKKLSKLIEQSDCILIGPGLGLDFKGNNTLTFLFQNIQPHQTLITKLNHTVPECEIILTTQQKEWERLSNIPVEEQTYEREKEGVKALNATVVLKQHGMEL